MFLRTCIAASLGLVLAAPRASAQSAPMPESGQVPTPRDTGASPWIVDLNLGAPAFVDYLRLTGDATLGYRTPKLGLVATGGVNYYDLQTTGILTDNLHAWGGIEGFFLAGEADSKLRVQAHVVAGVDYYDATTIEANTTRGASFRFGDYDSLLLRGLVDLGAVWRANERWTLNGRLGGGIQHETYDTTSLDATGVHFVSPETLSARGTGSLQVTWRFWPEKLRARLYGYGSIFQLTRETVSFSATSTGQTQASLAAHAETQIEVRGRGNVDLEALRFAGFLPSAWIGVAYVSSSGASTVVPAAGLGLVRMN